VRQHSLWKIGVAVLAGTLALTACGGAEEDPPTTPSSEGSSEEPGGETSAGGEGEAACDLSLAFFGALTGDAANLGINIKQGAELAVLQYNEEHADCEVGLEELDSQGSPDQAPALAQEAINNEAVVGVVEKLGSQTELKRDIKKFERRGTKARTQVERELRNRRRRAERVLRRESDAVQRKADRKPNVVSQRIDTVSGRVEDAVQVGVATGERVVTKAREQLFTLA